MVTVSQTDILKLQELINYYQEHSLVHYFSSIDTKLKCPYYVIVGTSHKQTKLPWLTSQSLPPTTALAATPSDSAEQLNILPVGKYVCTSAFLYQ